MKTVKVNSTQPANWVAAWRSAAETEGVSLSEWMAIQCNKGLPKRVRAKLGKRKTIGRPPKPNCPTIAPTEATDGQKTQ